VHRRHADSAGDDDGGACDPDSVHNVLGGPFIEWWA
jgi:hypothetical protein